MTNVVVNRKLKVLNSQAFWRVYFISRLSLIFLKVKIVQCYFFLEDSVFKRKQKKKKKEECTLALMLHIYATFIFSNFLVSHTRLQKVWKIQKCGTEKSRVQLLFTEMTVVAFSMFSSRLFPFKRPEQALC